MSDTIPLKEFLEFSTGNDACQKLVTPVSHALQTLPSISQSHAWTMSWAPSPPPTIWSEQQQPLKPSSPWRVLYNQCVTLSMVGTAIHKDGGVLGQVSFDSVGILCMSLRCFQSLYPFPATTQPLLQCPSILKHQDGSHEVHKYLLP